jgi:predicted dehydrogenase
VLAERYGAEAGADWHAVLGADVDAFLIGPETSATPAILAAALETGKPILSEKPGAYASAELKALAGHPNAGQILVGYNRRHYSSTAAAKDFIQRASEVTFHASIPEASWTTSMPAEKKRDILLSNTVHVLDLLRYLCGDLQLGHVAKIDSDGIFSRAAVLASKAVSGTAIITFGSPSNYFIDLHSNGRSASMRPIEFYREFDSVSVIEPTPELPLRHYVSNQAGEFKLDQADLDFKPGFLSQMRELAAMVEGRTPATHPSEFKSATLHDAIAVLELAEALV